MGWPSSYSCVLFHYHWSIVRSCSRIREHLFYIPWRRKWQPASVFLPGENPMNRGAWPAIIHRLQELDTTEHAHTHTMNGSSGLVAKSCPIPCDLIDCSLTVSSVHETSQARILDWVAIFFSKGSFWPRDWTGTSCIAGGFFTNWATREVVIVNSEDWLYWYPYWRYAFVSILQIRRL